MASTLWRSPTTTRWKGSPGCGPRLNASPGWRPTTGYDRRNDGIWRSTVAWARRYWFCRVSSSPPRSGSTSWRIFPPETPLRVLELFLLRLNVPVNRLTEGITEVGASYGCADGLPADPRGRRYRDRRAREQHARRRYAGRQLRRPDQDRLHPGPQPPRAGSDRPGRRRPAHDGALLRRLQAGIPAPDALHPGFGRAPLDARPQGQEPPGYRRSGDGIPVVGNQLRGAARCVRGRRLRVDAPLPAHRRRTVRSRPGRARAGQHHRPGPSTRA